MSCVYRMSLLMLGVLMMAGLMGCEPKNARGTVSVPALAAPSKAAPPEPPAPPSPNQPAPRS